MCVCVCVCAWACAVVRVRVRGRVRMRAESYSLTEDQIECDGCIAGEASITLTSAPAAAVQAIVSGLSLSLTSSSTANYSLFIHGSFVRSCFVMSPI